MHIAICISGTTKYYQNSLKSIQEFFSDQNPKIFLHTYNISPLRLIEDSWSKHKQHEYLSSEKLNTSQIAQLYAPTYQAIEDYDQVTMELLPHFLELTSVEDINLHSIGSNIGPISMHYSIRAANALKSYYEKENAMKFDVVIRMRYDSEIKIMNPLNQYDLNKINIPIYRDWMGGINDQFAFGPSELMDKYSNLFPTFGYHTRMCGIYHPETIFRTYLKDINIEHEIVRPKILVDIVSDISYTSQNAIFYENDNT